MKQRTLQHAGLVASVVALLLLGTNRTHAIINGTALTATFIRTLVW